MYQVLENLLRSKGPELGVDGGGGGGEAMGHVQSPEDMAMGEVIDAEMKR